MIANPLISAEFGVRAEEYPSDLAGQPYPDQVAATGAAWFPDALQGSKNLLELFRRTLDESCANKEFRKHFRLTQPEKRVDTIVRPFAEGFPEEDIPKHLVPALALYDDAFEVLREVGLPAPSKMLTPVIKGKSYPPRGGIGRHGDNNEIIRYPLVIVGLDELRETEVLTADGRLLRIASTVGGLLVLPQARGIDADKRNEHAVLNTSRTVDSHTMHLLHAVAGESKEVLRKQDEIRWGSARSKLTERRVVAKKPGLSLPGLDRFGNKI